MGRGIELRPGFCILWSLLLLTLPLRLLLAAMAAAGFHELCHWAAVRLLGGQVLGLSVGAEGMVMETTPMTKSEELLCSLAGPAGSFVMMGLYRWFPLAAFCGMCQGLFNLLPLYPLDGGRAAACLVPEKWMKIIEFSTLSVLLVLAVAIRMGIGPVLLWTMLAARKIPCKDHGFGVQ